MFERYFRGVQVLLNTEIPWNVLIAFLVGWCGSFIGIPSVPLMVIVVFLLFSNTPLNFSGSIASEGQEVREIQEERKKIIDKIEKDDSVIDIIQLNLNQITEYYTINKNQARRSFSFSVLVIFVGFIAVIAAVLIPFFQKGQKLELSIISGISGILLQFIGGANFVLYNRTVEQSNRFYQQLTRMQDTMLAVELCKQVKDEKKTLHLMEKLISALIERSSSGSEAEQQKNVLSQKAAKSQDAFELKNQYKADLENDK